MPMIMRSIRDIMAERQRDTVFVEFPDLHSSDEDDHSHAVVARQRHWAFIAKVTKASMMLCNTMMVRVDRGAT